MSKTILFVGGGSVGHIAPSVAVWRACQKENAQSSAHFVCGTRQGEKEFLENEKVSYTQLDAPRLSLSFLWKFPRAICRAKKILAEVKPSVVFSKGGYVSVPMCIAAKKKNIPIVLHESDAVSGNANKMIMKMANHICFGLPIQKKSKNVSITGNPVRENSAKGSKKEGQRITGFDESKPVLLVIGGSQGAQAINEAVCSVLPELLKVCNVCHITGKGKAVMTSNPKGYWQTPFAQAELRDLYALADVALSRAGAGIIAELAANSIPTIVVPLRGVGHDHQQKNMEFLASKNACMGMQQTKIEEELVATIQKLFADKKLQESLAQNLAKLHPQDAALQIARILLQSLAI